MLFLRFLIVGFGAFAITSCSKKSDPVQCTLNYTLEGGSSGNPGGLTPATREECLARCKRDLETVCMTSAREKISYTCTFVSEILAKSGPVACQERALK
jgi:hypothetical protein